MKNTPISFIAVAIAVMSTSAFATTGTTQLSGRTRSLDQPFELFAGASFGYSTLNANNFASKLDGTQLNLTALGAFRLGQFVFDLGGGWYTDKVSGEMVSGLNSEVNTRTGYAEFSPKVLLSDRWQLGPVLDRTFGSNINGNTNNWLVGLQGLYQLPLNNFDIRFMARAMTNSVVNSNTDVNGRTWTALTGIQIGLPLFGGGSEKTEVARAPAPRPARWTEQPVVVKQAVPVAKKVRVTLSSKLIHFATNSAALESRYNQNIHALSTLLVKNPDLYSSVDVAGHSDARGSYEYNLKLSQERALGVEKALIKNGVPENRFNAKGFSFNEPIAKGNNPQAWAQNRRVELVFHDVKDPEAIRKIFEGLNY